MSYYEAFVDAPFNTDESCAEIAAHHQRSMDVLYLVGNQYDLRIDHMKLLCDAAGISFEEFCRYSGKPVTCKTDIF